MNWVDYRERLGIGFGDNDMLQRFINRTRNLTRDLDDFYFNDDLFRYANTVGVDYGLFRNGSIPLHFALVDVCESFSFKDFLSKYVALINSSKRKMPTENGERRVSELFETIIIGALEAFCIPYEIIHDTDGVFIFPKGIPEFDKALISDSFIWLSQYPETEKAWGKALRAYSSGEEPSEVADLFRKTLERFFQNYFGSEKSIEKLKSEYGRCLKEHGIPSDLVSNFESLLKQYTDFNNNYAKHHDRTSNLVLEYMMYQTGNIMRLLIQLSDEDQEKA